MIIDSSTVSHIFFYIIKHSNLFLQYYQRAKGNTFFMFFNFDCMIKYREKKMN